MRSNLAKSQITKLFLASLIIITTFILIIFFWLSLRKPYSQILKSVPFNESEFISLIQTENQQKLVLTDSKGDIISPLSETGYYITNFTLSADKNFIAYAEGKDMQNIWLKNLSTSENIQITQQRVNQTLLSFNENSTKLALTTPTELYVSNTFDPELVRLKTFEEYNENSGVAYVPQPYWKNNQIILELRAEDYFTAHNTDTYAIDSETGAQHLFAESDDFVRLDFKQTN